MKETRNFTSSNLTVAIGELFGEAMKQVLKIRGMLPSGDTPFSEFAAEKLALPGLHSICCPLLTIT